MIRQLVACAALLWCAAPAAAQPSAPRPMDASAYAGWLRHSSDRLADADRSVGLELCRSTPDVKTIGANGAVYDVRLDWLRREACDASATDAAWRMRRDELQARIRSAALEAGAEPDTALSAQDARPALERILSQRGFQRARSESWRAALIRRIVDWFTDLWERLVGPRVGGRWIAEGLAWLAGLGALGVLMWWLIRMMARQRTERPITVGSIEAPRTPGHVLGARAAELIRGGDLREGARVAYRAAIARLEEEGALRPDDTRTPRESLRLLPGGHRRRAPLGALTAIFERIWYGWREPDAESGEAILRLLRDLECLSFDRAK